jgi:hypothetical protein
MLADIVMRPYSKTTVRWENMAIDKLINLWTGKTSAEPVCKDIAAEKKNNWQWIMCNNR